MKFLVNTIIGDKLTPAFVIRKNDIDVWKLVACRKSLQAHEQCLWLDFDNGSAACGDSSCVLIAYENTQGTVIPETAVPVRIDALLALVNDVKGKDEEKKNKNGVIVVTPYESFSLLDYDASKRVYPDYLEDALPGEVVTKIEHSFFWEEKGFRPWEVFENVIFSGIESFTIGGETAKILEKLHASDKKGVLTFTGTKDAGELVRFDFSGSGVALCDWALCVGSLADYIPEVDEDD